MNHSRNQQLEDQGSILRFLYSLRFLPLSDLGFLRFLPLSDLGLCFLCFWGKRFLPLSDLGFRVPSALPLFFMLSA